jgi:hypothetical protein
MGVDTAKAHQPTRSEAVAVQFRDFDVLGITDNDVGDLTAAGDKERNLSLDLLGKGCCLPGHFPGDDLL